MFWSEGGKYSEKETKPHCWGKKRPTRKPTLPLNTCTSALTVWPVPSSRLKHSARCLHVFTPPWTWWEGGEVYPKTSLDHWERRCLFPPHRSHDSSVDLLIPTINLASYSSGVGRDFEPEDAPTGHSDTVCLVFLLFPRSLYQVREQSAILSVFVRVIFSLINCFA